MRARTSRVVVPAALAAVLLLLGACANVVDGHGAGSAAPTRSLPPTEGNSLRPTGGASANSTASPITSPSASTATTPTTPASSGPNAGSVLVPLLEQGPANSNPWNDAWGRNVTPTVEQFVAHLYTPASQANIVATLRSEGLIGVAHRTWIADTETQADVILMLYSTEAGAQGRLDFAVQAKAATAGIKRILTPSSPQVLITYYRPTPDSDGFINAITYTRVKRVVMEVFTFSPDKLSTGELVSWSQAQVALLR